MKIWKNKSIWFVLGMIIVYMLLVGFGELSTDGKTGYTGLGDAPALSSDDKTIIFPYFQNDEASLYIATREEEAQLLAEPDQVGHSYIRPAIAPSAQSVAFIHSWTEEKKPYKQLMFYENGKVRALLDKNQFVTEVTFSPDGKYLYYAKSDLYTNYSTVSQEHPHKMDIYRMNLETKIEEPLTDMEAYDLSSLNVWNDTNVSYRTYEGKSFEGQDVMKVLNVDSRETTTIKPSSSFETPSPAPIFSNPTPSPSHERIAFSDVGSTNDQGTFEYELFLMDQNGENIEQVTTMRESVNHPVFFETGKQILVTVNHNFAGQTPDNEYWVIDLENDERKQWNIQMPE